MVKVALLGAAGGTLSSLSPFPPLSLISPPPPPLPTTSGIGQPLALLLKTNPAISHLALFDVVPVVKGVAADISHVDSPSTTSGHVKDEGGLKEALTGAQVVVIPAGVPRKVRLPSSFASFELDAVSSVSPSCPAPAVEGGAAPCGVDQPLSTPYGRRLAAQSNG